MRSPKLPCSPCSPFVSLCAQVMLWVDGMCVGGFQMHQVAGSEHPRSPWSHPWVIDASPSLCRAAVAEAWPHWPRRSQQKSDFKCILMWWPRHVLDGSKRHNKAFKAESRHHSTWHGHWCICRYMLFLCFKLCMDRLMWCLPHIWRRMTTPTSTWTTSSLLPTWERRTTTSLQPIGTRSESSLYSSSDQIPAKG